MSAAKSKATKTKTTKSKAPNSKAHTVAEIVAACAARLPSQRPTLGNLQELSQMFRVEFGHLASSESKTEYSEDGSPWPAEKLYVWKLPENQSLSLHYSAAGIQVLHGFIEDPDANVVLLHLTKTEKVNPRLLTVTRFDNLIEGVSAASAQDAPVVQREVVQNMLALLLGNPQNEGESPTNEGFMEWCVANAELTLAWNDKGITLDLADLGA